MTKLKELGVDKVKKQKQDIKEKMIAFS